MAYGEGQGSFMRQRDDETQAYLTDFFIRAGRENLADFNGLYEALSGEEKGKLQELAQGSGLPLPEYSVVDEVGPDHDKRFIVEVRVGSLSTRGEDSSKKEAQQQAAKHALRESASGE